MESFSICQRSKYPPKKHGEATKRQCQEKSTTHISSRGDSCTLAMILIWTFGAFANSGSDHSHMLIFLTMTVGLLACFGRRSIVFKWWNSNCMTVSSIPCIFIICEGIRYTIDVADREACEIWPLKGKQNAKWGVRCEVRREKRWRIEWSTERRTCSYSKPGITSNRSSKPWPLFYNPNQPRRFFVLGESSQGSYAVITKTADRYPPVMVV